MSGTSICGWPPRRGARAGSGSRLPCARARMELCVAIEAQEGVSWEDWTALAEACEAHGVATLYSSDHYLSTAAVHQRAALDAWGVLCALAATTSTLRLGTLV